MIPKGDEDWEWLMQLTGMDAIQADDVLECYHISRVVKHPKM